MEGEVDRKEEGRHVRLNNSNNNLNSHFKV